MKTLNIALTVVAAAALASAHAQEAYAPGYYASEVTGQAGTAKVALPKQATSTRATVTPTVVQLGALDDSTLIAKQATVENPHVRITGAGRASEKSATVEATSALLQWQTLADGRQVAALQYESGNAYGIRLGLLVKALPTTAVVRVYAPGNADSAHELTGARILEVLARNAEAEGVSAQQANTYWLPTIDGDAAVVEIEIPASATTSDVQVAVPAVSHIFESAENLTYEQQKAIGDSEACNYNASCQPEIESVRKSVARMSFVLDADGNTATCTGTLLADKGRTGTPYLLSAAHCIDNQPVASTLETDWRFHTQSCTDSTLSNLHTRLEGEFAGASLVYSNANYDTTLLVLDHPPQGDVLYAGWWSSQELHQSVYGISHPSGDLQKVSYGRISSYMVCTEFDASGSTSCHPGLREHSDFFDVNYSYGTTEGGSSGSGLFARHQDGNYYVTGVLSAGSASCTVREGSNIYGRFDRAYEDGLKYFIGDKSTQYMNLRPIYRFYNTSSGSHFYTQSAQERDLVIRSYPAMFYEGEAYWAYTSSNSQLAPVYRFYNSQTGAHFYTISEQERQVVQNSDNAYQFEGIAWFARAAHTDGAQPVYRYYNRSNDTHFYTINYQEKLLVDAIYPNFSYDGIAYYAWPVTSQ